MDSAPVWPIVVGTLISLTILFVLFSRWLYYPIKEGMEKRDTRISNNIKDSEKLNKDALISKKLYDKNLSEIKKEKALIKDEAIAEGVIIKSDIINEAKSQAQKIVDDSETYSINQKKNLINEAEKEIGEIAIQIAEKVIEENLSSKSNEKFIEDLLKDIDNE